jgi:hypothetical protein
LLLVLLTLPAMVQAQFNYIITNATVTITGYTGSGGAVTIPSTIQGLPVTGIGPNAFDSCGTLTSVTIPDSVTSIGDHAFMYCTGVTDVTLGSAVSSIGFETFSWCTNLISITIGSNVTNIGQGAFSYCTSLASIIIPDSVSSIAVGAFESCWNLTGITIPSSVSSIGCPAFAWCSRLSAITVDAFNPVYSSLEGVLFNKSQATILEYPGGKAGSYTVPNSVTSIGPYAFMDCFRLTSITLPDSITSIQYAAFSSCTGLACVTIPNSVTDVGDFAFWECESLQGAYFMGNAPSGASSWTFYGDNSATVYYLPGTIGWSSTFGGRPTAVWVQLPTIQTPPQTQTAEAGSAVSLRVRASSPLPLFYFWYFNATNLLSSGTNWQVKLPEVQFDQSGAYIVAISNVLGAITSAPALLNVIAPVERRPVPGVKLTGQVGSLLNLDSADFLRPAPNWTPLASVSLTGTSQYWFDLTGPLPPQRFFRAWQAGALSVMPSLELHLVPAITLTGSIGGSVRVDAINRFGPIDAWFTLGTVTLTNTSQLYFDISAWGQPQRLYRLVQIP